MTNFELLKVVSLYKNTSPIMKRKLLISIFLGSILFILSWLYINSFYSISAEDTLFRKIAFIKFQLFNQKENPEIKNLEFIDVSHDLALIEDPDINNYGNIAITDRTKIYEFLKLLRENNVHPKFIVLDIQFYIPFTAENDTYQNTDSLLQAEILKFKNISAPLLLDKNGKPIKPLIKTNFPSIASYKTYGTTINKIKIDYPEFNLHSTSLVLYQNIRKANFKSNSLFSTDNGILSLNYIWPEYPITAQKIEELKKDYPQNIGEIILVPDVLKKRFDHKIIFVGNFETDIHQSPIGKIPGTVVLANTFLSLEKGVHHVSLLWILLMITIYSFLFYLSIYSKVPEVNFKFKFIFSNHLSDFIKGYLSYFGIMFFATLFSYLIFRIFVNVMIISFLFSIIDYFKSGKYKPS